MDSVQQRAVELLVAGLEEFEAFINQMMDDLNIEREEDEHVFNSCKETDPNALSLKLRNLLVSQNSNICSISAYLLRVHFLDDALMWNRLGQENSSAIITTLKDEVHYQEEDGVRRNFCDAISAVLSTTRSADLLWTTVRWVTKSSPRAQEIGILILANCQPLDGQMLSVVRNLYRVFSDCLNTGPLNVQVSVLIALCKFLPHMLNDHLFLNLLPLMVGAVRGMLRDGEEESAQTSLNQLLLMVANEPRCLEGHVEVLSTFLGIGRQEGLEVSTRNMSLRFVTAFLRGVKERAPQMMPSLVACIRMLIQHLMEMLKDLEAMEDWYYEGEEEPLNAFPVFFDRLNENTWDYTEEPDSFRLGKLYLDTMVEVLDREDDFPIAPPQLLDELSEYMYQLLSTYLVGGGGNEWQSVHSGIMAFSIIGEQVVTNNSFRLLVGTMLEAVIEEPHPVVEWAGISTFMKLYRGGGQDIRNLIANETYELLRSCSNKPNLKVRERASLALLLFASNMDVGNLDFEAEAN